MAKYWTSRIEKLEETDPRLLGRSRGSSVILKSPVSRRFWYTYWKESLIFSIDVGKIKKSTPKSLLTVNDARSDGTLSLRGQILWEDPNGLSASRLQQSIGQSPHCA